MQMILVLQNIYITTLKNIGVNLSYNFNFHLSFKPETSHMSEFLKYKFENETKENIGRRLGIATGSSSGKVVPMMLYCAAANLISYTANNQLYSVEQTTLGNYIKEIDPSLESYDVKTFIHYNFCTFNSKMTVWELLFRQFASHYKCFSRSVFLTHISDKYQTKIYNKSITPVIKTYIDDGLLTDLNILTQCKKDKYEFGRIRIVQNSAKWYAFYLYDFLKRLDSTKRDFHLSDLKSNGFHSIFGWNGDDLFAVMDILENNGYICMDKQYNDTYFTIYDLVTDNIVIK